MKLIIDKNRKVYSAGTWGTVNENDYEILEFEFPAELDGYNKRIVYYLGDERVWDTIVNNKAYITNAITTKGDVKAYVWCTKENTEREADTDFRTMLFEMHFYENENADGIVPTEVQVDGFNTMLTAMNNKIAEIDTLETAIENAETQRQENEETRQENESTRQDNEQTRQEQEADRERRTNEAIGQITDMTQAYNQNAQEKTNAFNQNSTNKTTDFNSNASSKKSDFNSNAESKTTTFNNNASSKTSDFNTNATNKTNAFDSNATEETTTFDNNATEKTSEFNTNAESKTSAFNDNATQKTTNFDNNASEKTDEFNTNAQEKIDEYDEHIVEYQAQIDELQEEVEELSENMPWNETEQATEIDITDAAKYSKNKMKVFGNTQQTQYSGKNLLKPGTTKTENGITFSVQEDGTIIANGTATANASINLGTKDGSPVDLPAGTYTISGCPSNGSSTTYRMGANLGGGNIFDYGNGVTTTLASDVTDKRIWCIIYSGVTVNNLVFKPMLEIGDAKTDYEPYVGGPSPNPDYPQDIHVVTGENDIYWTSNENKLDLNKNYIKGGINSDTGAINSTANPTITLGNNSISVYTSSAWNGYISDYYDCQSKDIIQLNFVASTNYFWVAIAEYDLNKQYIKATPISNTSLREINIKTTNETKYLRLIFEGSRSRYSIDFTNINFVFQNHVILNLGSLELCKIGNYQDYLYKENGNWYKYGNIDKIIINGSENIILDTTKAITQVFNIQNVLKSHGYIKNVGYCNCFINQPGDTEKFSYINTGTLTMNLYIATNKTRASTVEEFKSWLSNHNIIFYYPILPTTNTQIIDETLISQLEAIYNHLALVKGTNHITITPSDLAPYVTLNYMQDLPSKLDNLDSRLSLLE